jgi:hypothetical protein
MRVVHDKGLAINRLLKMVPDQKRENASCGRPPRGD